MRTISLTQGKVALVDDEDFERLNKYKWIVYWDGWHWYAQKTTGKRDSMHRFILGLSDEKIIVDHRNHDGLDNRKENLICTDAGGNSRNRKPKEGRFFKGISYIKETNKWRARITNNKRSYELGCYNTPDEAALAYNKAAKKYHKSFAWLNHI